MKNYDPKQIISELPNNLYINGKWVSAGGERIEVDNPATEEIIATVEVGSDIHAKQAVDAAEKGAKIWQNDFSARQRAEIIRRAFEILVERADYYAHIITLEHGKPLAQSVAEVKYSAEFFRWFAEEGVRNIGEYYESPTTGSNIMVHHKPAGISLLITPWNFPLSMGTRKIGPALAAGCPVIVKPASATPFTVIALAQVLEEAGVPPGVVNILPCKGSSNTINVILEDPRVRVVSFTGSTYVGKTLLVNSAKNVLNCSMELGGNAPFIITENADLQKALEGAAVAKMRNMGESCVAANRFYVHESQYEKFIELFSEKMTKMKVGNGLEEGVEVGPVINRKAQKDVHVFVEDAISKGAKIVIGGIIPEGKGCFYPPTVLRDVSEDSKTVCEEIFGPVAPIRKYSSEEEMIKEANNSPDGLAGYVYSEDITQAVSLSKKLEVGMVGVNRGMLSDPAAPFGGVKQSGLGREGSHEGLMEFLETQYLSIDL